MKKMTVESKVLRLCKLVFGPRRVRPSDRLSVLDASSHGRIVLSLSIEDLFSTDLSPAEVRMIECSDRLTVRDVIAIVNKHLSTERGRE